MRGVREEGVVLTVDARGASIRIAPASEERCASCGACGSSGPSGTRVLEVPGTEGLTAGARVVVETAPVPRALAGLLLLFAPLLGALAGAIVGVRLGPAVGLEGEAGPIVGGLVGLVAVYVGVTIVDRAIRRRRGGLRPRIVSVRRRSPEG